MPISCSDPKVAVLLQARTGSSRFPGKILETIGDRTILQWVYHACVEAERILRAEKIKAETWVIGPEVDASLHRYCTENLIKLKQPSCAESDLLVRYLKAAEDLNATHLVRITSDCWQMNPYVIAETVKIMLREKVDYISNTIHRSEIEGMDCQACSLKAMKWFVKNQQEEFEHPFKPFEENKKIRDEFEKDGLSYIERINPKTEWVIRTSIDTKDDLERARRIYDEANRQGLVS